MLKGVYSWCFGALCLGRACLNWFFKFFKSCNLFFFFFSGSGYGYLNVGRGVFYQRRSHLKWLFFFFLPTFLQAKIEIVMGKRFSSFAGLNFGVWVLFEKMGHTGFGWGWWGWRTYKKCWHMAVGLGFVFVFVSFDSFLIKSGFATLGFTGRSEGSHPGIEKISASTG